MVAIDVVLEPMVTNRAVVISFAAWPLGTMIPHPSMDLAF